MGFWSRVKDVLVSGPTAAAGNAHEEKREPEAPESHDDIDHTTAPPAEVPEPTVEAQPEPDVDAETQPAAEPEYRTYTVKPGDTLSEIAAGFGVDWHEMARLNDLENPDLIFPGQVFKVPN